MKKYLILALIAVMMFTQTVSAQTGEVNGSLECTDPSIDSVTIVDDDGSTMGVQVQPKTAEKCLGVLKCDATPTHNCTLEGGHEMCQFNKVGTDVGMETGTYCLNPSHKAELCSFIPPQTGCADTCEFDENSNWIGPQQGGYTYNPEDGYKMGLKVVNVSVTVTNDQGIDEICNNGHVTITIDNYDLQGAKKITLTPGPLNMCDGSTTGTWIGNFTMHYWEKPGWYTVTVDVENCPQCSAVDVARFMYTTEAKLCIAPGNKMTYTPALQNGVSSYVNGDVIASNCLQCDIETTPPTIRNIGNALINVLASSSPLACDAVATPNCAGNQIDPETGTGYGRLYIDLGNGFERLWASSHPHNMSAQDYCYDNVTQGCPTCQMVKVPVPGLPPGPHATNNMSLRVDMLNLKAGTYKQIVTIQGVTTAKCCEDHRESAWPARGNCVTPPQCYETGRYCSGILNGACDQPYNSGDYQPPFSVCTGLSHSLY